MSSFTGRRSALFALFFLSGATSLVYQVLWLRLLILIFGSTLFATSAILTTFMAGLALGAFLAGRAMDGSRRSPLVVYGWLEIGIGLYALVVPTLFEALTPVYRWVWSAGGQDSLLLLNAAKFVGIAAVLLLPTTLMGASLPVLAREVAGDPRRIGGQVGALYAVNTFGAVLGTFLAGFVAIPTLGVRRTMMAAAAGNLALGAAAVLLGRGAAPAPAGIEPAAARPAERRVTLLLAVFAASGFGAMVLEVAWTRTLALVLGSSVYAFSLMLVAFLIGLASGGAFFAARLRRSPAIHPGTLLAALLVATGLLSFATAFVFQHLPRLFGEVYFSWRPGPNGWFAVQFLFGLLIMFPATFAFGGIFPAVVQLHARGLEHVASTVGSAYAANTAGTILGAAVAGFVLVPALGVQGAVIAIACSQIVLGAIVLARLSAVGRAARLGIAAALVAVAAVLPTLRPGWDTLLMNSGVYMNLQDLPEGSQWSDFTRALTQDNVLVYAEEGMTASVLVADQPSLGNRYLAVNGKIEASTNADMETQLLCAHLPLLLHERPRDVLVIGLASGITVGAAASHPVDSIRVAEIEKAMVPAARLFDEHNGHVLDDPRVRVSVNDARNELVFADRTYDVIVSEPSNPWMTVASNLFTEEFFRTARERLNQGGLFSQWVQNYYLPYDDLRSIVASFRAVFPHVWVFETFGGVDLLLIGSERPAEFDVRAIGQRMEELTVRMDLARAGIHRATDLLPLFLLGPSEVDAWVAGAERNTDDNARVEFSAPTALYTNTLDSNLARLRGLAPDPFRYVPVSGEPTVDQLRLAYAWGLRRRGRGEEAEAAARRLLGGPLDGPAAEFLAVGENP